MLAAELRLHPVALHTSIRVQDSLEEGVSLYMAELLSLARVVRMAREEGAAMPVLYLVDEMLQGTNSTERRVAARTVLRHLLATGAIGAVTTHDLHAGRRGRPGGARHPHALPRDRRSGGRPPAPRLRLPPASGLATTTSALELLEMVGLGPGKARPLAGGVADPGIHFPTARGVYCGVEVEVRAPARWPAGSESEGTKEARMDRPTGAGPLRRAASALALAFLVGGVGHAPVPAARERSLDRVVCFTRGDERATA